MADSTLELALKIRAAVEGMDAVKNLGNSFVTTNQQIETLIRGLTAISGSSDGAAKEFDYLAEQARKYGISILDLSDNYVKFIASSKGTALEGEAARKIFEATASTMAVLGGETITTHRAFTALSQMMSKGQIYAEELKGQLAEAIPGALQIMAKGLGITTQEMLNLMKAGQLTSSALLPFAIQLEKQYGSLAASTTTFAQATNRLQTEWALLMKRMGDTGAWSVITGAVELLSKNSEVLAGVIGAGLGLAFQKLVTVIGLYGVAAKESVVSISAQSGALAKLQSAIGWTTSANELAAKAANEKSIADRAAAVASIEASRLSQLQALATEQQAKLAVEAKQREIASTKAKIAVISEEQIANDRLLQTKAANITAQERESLALTKSLAAYNALLVAKSEAIAAADAEVVASIAAEARSRAAVNLKTLEVVASKEKVASLKAEVLAIESGVTVTNLASTANERLIIEKEKLNNSNLRLTASEQAYAIALNNINLQQVIGANANLLTSEQKLLTSAIAREAQSNANVISTYSEMKAQESLVITERGLLSATLSVSEAKRLLAQETAFLNAEIAKGALASQKEVLESNARIRSLDLLIASEQRYVAAIEQQGLAVNELAAVEARHNASGLTTLDIETKKAYKAYVTAEANLSEARSKAALAAETVRTTEIEIAALSQSTTQTELLKIAKQRLFEQNIRLSASQEQLTAATLTLGNATNSLANAQRVLAQSGAYEVEISKMNLAQKEIAARQATELVAKTEAQILQIERKIAALAAEGGTTQQVATLEAELALLRDRSALATARQVIATNAVVEARAKEVAVTGVANVAAKAYLATQTLLSRSWALLTGPTGMIAMMVAGFAYMFVAFREQDEVTKNLNKSTEEYTKSLESMSAAQVIQSNNASRKLISDIKERIDMLQKEIAVYSDQSYRDRHILSLYTLGNMFSWLTSKEELSLAAQEDLNKANAELAILEGKRAIGIEALGKKYSELVSSQNSLVGSNAELISKQQEQRTEVDRLNAIWFKSKEEVIALGIAHEALNATTKQVTESNKALGNASNLTKAALSAFAEQTGLTEQEVRAAFDGNVDYISSLDAQAKAVVESIRRGIELGKVEAANEAQLKQLNSEYKRIEGSIKAKTDATIREAELLDDLEAKRVAEVQGKRVLIDLAELGIKTVNKELDVINNQIALKKEEAIQNEKESANINKNIVKLESQREELLKTKATREANLAVVKAEAIATEVANNLISESFIKNQAIIADSSNRIRELQTEYKNLGVTSESVFNKKQTEILEQIRIEQEKVTDAARTMGVAMKGIFSTLGLDYDEAISGMDYQTRRMIDAFGLLGQGGIATAAQIQNAFTDVLGKSDTEAELKALKFQLEQLGAAGVISLESMRLKMTEVDAKLVDVEGAVNPVTIAFTKLGIGVPEQLQSIANSFGIAFDVIKDSAAPIEQVQSAFMKYAEAQVTASIASGNAIPKILEQEAASLGLSNAYQALIEKSRLVNREFEAVVELFAKSNAELSQYQAKVEAVNSTELEWLNTKAQAAEVLGDEEAKRLALIAVSEQELVISRQQITVNQEKLNAANAELAALSDITESGKKLSKEQQQRLTDLKAEIPLLEQQVSASKAKAEQSKDEALATKLANSIISEEFARQQKIVELASSEVSRLRTAYDTLKDAGAPVAVLNGILAQIAEEQKKVADGAKGMDAAMNAAFNAVGLNYQEVVTGMDADTKRMIDAFAFSATSAAASAESIQKAFTDVLAKANTEQELVALQEELIKLGSQGKISGDQLAQALAAVNTKAVELRAAVDPLQIAMEKLGIGVPEKLAAVANESERLYLTIKNSKAPIDEVQQAFLKYAENALVAAENGAKINVVQLEAEASALGLGNAFTELKKKVSESSAEFEAIIAKYEKLTIVQGKEIELAKASVVATGERNKSSILLNENLGNELGLIADLIQEDQVKINLLKQEVIENEKKLEQNTRELSDLRRLRDSGEQLSVTQRERLELLEAQLPIDEKGIEQSKEKVRQAESEALSYQNIVGDLNKVIAVAQQELNQSNEVLNSKKEKLEAEKALAIANGDTVKAQEKSIEIAKVELEIAKNIALAKREVAKATEEYAASLLKQAQADQIVTEEEQKAIDSANKLVAAKKLEADTADINVKAAEKNVEATKNVGKATDETAAKTKEASKGLVQFSKDWWDLTDAASAYYDTSLKLGKGTDFRWLGELKAGFDSAAQAEREAAAAAGLLQDAFSQIDSGTFRGATSDIVQLMAITKKAEQVSYEYGFSVTQAGRDAISVINEIEQKWNELANTIESRNADLRAQLAELKGDQTAAESIRNQVDYTNNLAEAEAQLALVQNSSNITAIAQAKQNLQLIREIYEAKQAEIDLAAQQEKASRNVTSSTTTASSQMGELATNAERAASAISALNGVNLGGIQGQFNDLNKSVNGLNSLL